MPQTETTLVSVILCCTLAISKKIQWCHNIYGNDISTFTDGLPVKANFHASKAKYRQFLLFTPKFVALTTGFYGGSLL
jgi:hypothetical protein